MIDRIGPRSIRWRLQLGLAVLLAGVLSGFGFTVYRLQHLMHFSQIDGELEVRVSALNKALRDAPFTRFPPPPPGSEPPHDGDFRGPPPGGGRGPGPADQKPDDLSLPADSAALFGSYYYVVWYRDGSVIQRSPGVPDEGDSPHDLDRDTLTHWRTRQGYREAFHCSGFGDCVLAGRSIEPDLVSMRNFALILFAAGGTVLAIGLGVGWRVTIQVIRPIEQISAAASRISQGNLSERIQVARRDDELGLLAGVLNRTFARLESAFSRQRQFTADAAHELRTPLAVIISETQTTLARERTAAEYRETVEGCLDTAQQMRRLTDSLLTLASFDAGERRSLRAAIDLADVARDCVERIAPLAAKHGVRIHADLAHAEVFASEEPLRQVITNLLSNAIRYNKPDGEVRLATFTNPAFAIVSITDTGIGISPANLPHIFDRFYRVNQARTRTQESTGLGLAICKTIVDAEGGKIDVASIPNEGTTFTVRFPKSQ